VQLARSPRRPSRVGLDQRPRLSLKARRKPGDKPFREGKYGDDLYRKTGKWNELERTIDRANDRYREKITDPETGDVIRDLDEPLSKHRGRGDAKRRPRAE
jgi:hypothetical protein